MSFKETKLEEIMVIDKVSQYGINYGSKKMKNICITIQCIDETFLVILNGTILRATYMR